MLCAYTATQFLELSLENLLHLHWPPKSKRINNIFLLLISILTNHEKIMGLISKFIYVLMIRHEAVKIRLEAVMIRLDQTSGSNDQTWGRRASSFASRSEKEDSSLCCNGNDISRKNIREKLCGQQFLPSYPHHPWATHIRNAHWFSTQWHTHQS